MNLSEGWLNRPRNRPSWDPFQKQREAYIGQQFGREGSWGHEQAQQERAQRERYLAQQRMREAQFEAEMHRTTAHEAEAKTHWWTDESQKIPGVETVDTGPKNDYLIAGILHRGITDTQLGKIRGNNFVKKMICIKEVIC